MSRIWHVAGQGPVGGEDQLLTAAGRALIDDVDAAAQLVTLGAVATTDTRLTDHRPAFGRFIPHPSNPVLALEGTETLAAPIQVWKEGATYHGYYNYTSPEVAAQIGHATSPDGKAWTKDAAHNPVLTFGAAGKFDAHAVWGPNVWKEGTTWYMFYFGQTSAPYHQAIGYATSSDGITWTRQNDGDPVLEGDVGEWDENDAEGPSFIIKVGSTYYLWYNTLNVLTNRQIGLATSTDLLTWTKDANNPIFPADGLGLFCAGGFKYAGFYYLIVSHNTSSTSGSRYAQFELYRDSSPTFYPADRVYLGVIKKTSQSGWDNCSLDNPFVLTDTIARDTFVASNGELWLYYAGARQSDFRFQTGLLISTSIDGLWQQDEMGIVPNGSIKLAALNTQAAETILANPTASSVGPSALALAEQRVLGRITGGHVKGLSIAELFTLLGITATAAELNYVDGVTSAIQTQLDDKALLGKFSRMQIIENDCWGNLTAQFAPLQAVSIASGTISLPIGGSLANHPGLLAFISSTTTNSGAAIVTEIGRPLNELVLAGGETFEFIWQENTSTGTTTRLGFHKAYTSADATNGVFIEIVDNTLVGRTIKSGAGAGTATTGTSYASITDTVFYRVKIVMNANATFATFSLYTCADGALVWTDTLSTYIPILAVGISMISTNVGTTAVGLITPDWYRISCSRVLVR